ncbi:unnamed protein product [Discosporangium mesarthrocarpum]
MEAAIRDGGREDRLSWSKRAEHTLRDELKDMALRKCDADISKFVKCSKDYGLLVVFACRQQSKEMNACLHKYTNEEEFQRYKLKRERELAQSSAE